MEALFNSNEVWQEMGTALGSSDVERVLSRTRIRCWVSFESCVGFELAFRASQCKCFLCRGLPDRVAVTLKRLP